MTLGWVDQPAPNEEGRQKSDGHGIVARPSKGGGGREAVYSNGVDLQLRIMERLRYMSETAKLEKLRCPLAEDSRETCLRFHSKDDCARYCKSSHAPLRGQSREEVLRYIRICRDAPDPSNKRKLNGDGDWGSCRGHWERSGGNGNRKNSEGKKHRRGAGYGGSRGGHFGGRQHMNSSGGGGARGGQC